MLSAMALPRDAEILMPGAGTGQLLDYLDPDIAASFRWVFTDINAAFLERLVERARRQPSLRYVYQVDDAERPVLRKPVEALLAELHYALCWRHERAVPDGKTMVGLLFHRTGAALPRSD